MQSQQFNTQCFTTKTNQKSFANNIDFKEKMTRRESMDTVFFDKPLNTPNPPQVEKKTAFDIYCTNLARNKKGRYLKKIPERDLYFFKCHLGHTFISPKKAVLNEKWCSSCAKLYKNAVNYAKEQKGTVLSEELDTHLQFKCQFNHEFSLHHKKILSKWCPICSKNAKQTLKNLLDAENKKTEEERAAQQVLLLERRFRKC